MKDLNTDTWDYAFHGTRGAADLESIVQNGLLPLDHPLVPTKPEGTVSGWYGSAKSGVYVANTWTMPLSTRKDVH